MSDENTSVSYRTLLLSFLHSVQRFASDFNMWRTHHMRGVLSYMMGHTGTGKRLSTSSGYIKEVIAFHG